MPSITRRDAVALVVALLLPLAAGGLGAIFTAEAIPTWYAQLAKPAWNPPGWLFGPVWTFLYITMGIAAWLIWRLRRVSGGPAHVRRVRTALVLWSAQLAINAVWSPVFFGLKRIDIALGVIVVLLLLILDTVRRFYLLRRTAALLLVPYLGWVAFATALNASIWQLNR